MGRQRATDPTTAAPTRRPPHARRAEPRRQDPAHRPQRPRAARPPVLPGGQRPHARSARRSTPRASATRSASPCGPNGRPRSGDVGWDTREEVDLAQAGPQLRLALLRGHVAARRLREHVRPARSCTRRRARAAGAPVPTATTRTARRGDHRRPDLHGRRPTRPSSTATSSSATTSRAWSSVWTSTRTGKLTGRQGLRDRLVAGVDIELPGTATSSTSTSARRRGSGSVSAHRVLARQQHADRRSRRRRRLGHAAAEGHLQGRRLQRPRRRHAQLRVGLRRRHREEHGARPASTPTHGRQLRRPPEGERHAGTRARPRRSRISVGNSPPVGDDHRAGRRRDVPRRCHRAALGLGDRPRGRHAAGARSRGTSCCVHGNHMHAFQTMTGKTGSFTPPRTTTPTPTTEIKLTATDSDGLEHLEDVDVRPRR